MDNFTALFNAFEIQTDHDNRCLFQVQQNNVIKQGTIARLKEKVAQYKELEAEYQRRRENAECRHEELMRNLSSNLTCAKVLQVKFDKLTEQSTVQAKTEQELRAKICDLNAMVSRIAVARNQLCSSIQSLKQPVPVAPNSVAVIQEMRKKLLEKFKMRCDAFDMTVLVTELQTIEQQRHVRLEVSEELRVKFEHSSAQDVDNDMLQEKIDILRNDYSNTDGEVRKVADQKGANDIILTKEDSSKSNLHKELGSIRSKVGVVEHHTLELKLKQAELGARSASASLELGDKSAKVQRDEMVLQASREEYECKESETSNEIEKIENSFQQQCSELSQNLEIGRKAMTEVEAESEKLKEWERLLFKNEEDRTKSVELQSKLIEMKRDCEGLLKKAEERRASLAKETMKIGELRQGAESNKLANEQELANTNMEVSGLQCEVMRLEAEVKDMKNKNCQLEGEVRSIKHQVLTKSSQLTVAKENFSNAQESAIAAVKLKTPTPKNKVGEGGKEKKNHSQFVTNPPSTRRRAPRQNAKADQQSEVTTKKKEKLCNQPLSSSRLARSAGANPKTAIQSELQSEQACNDNRKGKTSESGNVVEYDSFPNTGHRGQMQVDPRNSDSDGVKSSSLQHTTTLASTFAEEFKRDIAANMDDSMLVENDDNDDLFGGQDFGTPLNKNGAAVGSPVKPNIFNSADDDIHFEPNELFTSTPLIVKKQCTVRPTRAKSSSRNDVPSSSQAALKMLPMKRSGESTVAPSRRGKNRGRPRWKP
nr:myosin heavy chain [Haemonchus contortus]